MLIGRDGQVCLLAPAALPEVDARHLITVTRDGKKHTFMGVLRIDANFLRLAGFSLFGTSLFNISWNGHTLDVRPPQRDWHADTLVTMVELAIADPMRLRHRLHGLTLEVHHTDRGQVRKLFEHGHLRARIEKSAGPLARAHLRVDILPIDVSVRMKPIGNRP